VTGGKGALAARWRTLLGDLAATGSVVELDIVPGRVRARVKDGAAEHDVSIGFRRFGAKVFEKALSLFSTKASFAAELLSGRFPKELLETLDREGIASLPESLSELTFSCTCDLGGLCSHAATALVQLGAELESDPFLPMVLRGKPREEVLAALQRHRGRSPKPRVGSIPQVVVAIAEEPIPAIGERPEAFLGPPFPPASLRTSVAAPEHPDAVLARLGTPPLETEAANLLVDLHRAIGQGAAERLDEWEWRRVSGRRR